MKFSCQQHELNKALNIVGKIVANKNTLAILDNVLLKLKGDKLELITTNLEIAINHQIEVKGKENGEITVPVRLILNYIALLPAGNVSCTTNKDLSISLNSDGNKVDIKGLAAEEFPLIPEFTPVSEIKMPAGELKEGLESTIFATAYDQIRPVLTGVLIKASKKEGVIVGTDSYRLAEKGFSFASVKDETSCIIPNRTAAEMARILSSYQDEVALLIGENQVRLVLSDVSITSRLIEGNYPPYEQIIPQAAQTKITMNKEEFAQAVRRASLFARDRANNINLEFKGKDKLLIKSTSSQIGSQETELPVKIAGPEGSIAFNALYLLDVIGHIDEEELVLEITGSTKPGLIHGQEENDFRYIVMPPNLQ